jgi:hypothetical protein
MKKATRKAAKKADDDMKDHYDFREGVRGKHAAQFVTGTNVVRLDDDVAEVFHTPESVNAALRVLAQLVKAQAHKVPA